MTTNECSAVEDVSVELLESTFRDYLCAYRSICSDETSSAATNNVYNIWCMLDINSKTEIIKVVKNLRTMTIGLGRYDSFSSFKKVVADDFNFVINALKCLYENLSKITPEEIEDKFTAYLVDYANSLTNGEHYVYFIHDIYNAWNKLSLSKKKHTLEQLLPPVDKIKEKMDTAIVTLKSKIVCDEFRSLIDALNSLR